MTSPAHRALKTLGDSGLVMVIRGQDTDELMNICDECIRAGTSALEVTYTIPDPISIIRALRTRHPSVLIGAGTVTNIEQAEAAVGAGASFLVSPINPDFLLPFGRTRDVATIPGATTPSEIWSAVTAGASVVKIFPAASLGGPEYLQNLLGPFPELRCMMSGGIFPRDVDDYLEAGAWCVALGGTITNAPSADRPGLLAEAVARASHAVRPRREEKL